MDNRLSLAQFIEMYLLLSECTTIVNLRKSGVSDLILEAYENKFWIKRFNKLYEILTKKMCTPESAKESPVGVIQMLGCFILGEPFNDELIEVTDIVKIMLIHSSISPVCNIVLNTMVYEDIQKAMDCVSEKIALELSEQ